MSDTAATTIPNYVREIHERGFTSIPQLIDAHTVEELREYYRKILAGEIEFGVDDRKLGGLTRQVKNLSERVPYFRDNPATRAALKIGREILGHEPITSFDMLIYKPPGHDKSTPWHQDLAYYKMPVSEPGFLPQDPALQFWVALDDVDESNGCMHFLDWPPTRPMEPHYVYSGDPTDEGRLLASNAFGDPDLPNAGIPCRLKAGGCTIHYGATPHYTTPNITKDRGRRAYIFNMY